MVILTLLFQQVAVAAYACASANVPSAPSAMPGCAEMDMAPAKTPPPSALCQKHCAPDRSIASDHASPTVPSLALPPLHFAPVLDQSISRLVVAAEVSIRPTGPPPRLRYCSLLI